MPLNKARARSYLEQFNFQDLFIEELGWDHYQARPLHILIDGQSYMLNGLVEKRGMVVFVCDPDSSGNILPSTDRRKLENQVRKTALEHIVIYHDAANTRQKWQWVRREAGRPSASREHDYSPAQSGEALLQKLALLEIAVDEEADLTITEVSGRVRAAFDVDRVTRRFYERFKEEHTAFLKFIKGIDEQANREWYASLMLNRLMFCYFIQRKGFLDGDTDYLRNRLVMVKQKKGKNKFYSFYRHFLLRLFHEGLGGRTHTPELDELIGNVPYLNGGFFDIHRLEEEYAEIDIPDKAFEKVFDFFDQYQWHLDERPLRNDNEINPDVLGYIFEKYINQKQMGAYYTKEDITGYISRNTIVPWLFDTAKKKCEIAFKPDSALWRLLQEDPDRYLYPAMRKGVIADRDDVEAGRAKNIGDIIPLPDEIEAGVVDVAKRGDWNTPCSPEYALPTEIWREHAARRQRTLEIREKLRAGEVHEINDLITYNLDIVQFAEDAIDTCEGPELLRAFYSAIMSISVLDPTCGSGAFLFAALTILEPLYDACIDRMQWFVDDADFSGSNGASRKYKDFREILAQMAAHPSRRYFILKCIIINNLFGVDIMEEAVEICKLRLFLKLVAQVEDSSHIEPLPDIDFNIRAGNTLVGFATIDQFRNQSSLDAFAVAQYDEIIEDVEKISMAFNRFKSEQLEDKGTDTLRNSKRELTEELGELNEKLNRFLAVSYLGAGFKDAAYEKWKESHQPFHWFAEFYEIMHRGGFDVVIGNPPYIENKKITSYALIGFNTISAGNIYACMLERAETVGSSTSRKGFIVPVSSVSTNRYSSLQNILLRRQLWYSSYDDRPSRLFDGLEHIRLTIHIIGLIVNSPVVFSTKYNKWSKEERQNLFDTLRFVASRLTLIEVSMPKLTNPAEYGIVSKMEQQRAPLQMSYDNRGQSSIYYSRKIGYFLQILDFIPVVLDGKEERRMPSEFKELKFSSLAHAKCALACLNSNLFYWFITVYSDCRHVNKREVDFFPVDLNQLVDEPCSITVTEEIDKLMKHLQETSEQRSMSFKHDTLTVQCILPKNSKKIIDMIDRAIGEYYKFTPEELDYIINYDIKYRMGAELENV